jgi:hypothetical protein
MSAFSSARAIVFDLMGTCTDWKTPLLACLERQPLVPGLDLAWLATAWRAGFFKEIHRRFELGETGPAETIDVTHRKILDVLLEDAGVDSAVWGDETRQMLVQSWHSQTGERQLEASLLLAAPHGHSLVIPAWPDSAAGIEKLKQKYYV